MTVRLSTRGSQLALWQAHTTQSLLQQILGEGTVEVRTVRSSGDQDQTTDLARFGRIGIFTVEVDRALRDREAEIGVHSLKDMTTTLEEGIQLAAVLERGLVEDVLLSRDNLRLSELPPGARVATGSMRRRAMVLRHRPDVQVVEIRGNVETRLAKLERGEAEALIMARAGLVRLGLDSHITEVLTTDRFLPAVGQGIVGLTCRSDDAESTALLKQINHQPSWSRALAERALLRDMNAGCSAPLGAHAVLEGEQLALRAEVLSLDGKQCCEGSCEGPAASAEELGSQLAEQLLAGGAGELVEAARQ